MKRYWNLVSGVLLGLILTLALPLVVRAQGEGPWQLATINSPEVITMTEGISETAVQVALTRTAEITADRAVVYCTKPAGGRIISVTEPAIPVSVDGEIQAVAWGGPVVPSETVTLSYTLKPAGALESLTFNCRLYEAGMMQNEITTTVSIIPWRQILAIVMKNHKEPVPPEVLSIVDWDTWAGMDQDDRACTNPSYLQLWDVPNGNVMAGWLNYDGYKYEVFRSFMRFGSVNEPGKIVSGSITLHPVIQGMEGSQATVGLWTGAYPPAIDTWNRVDQYFIPVAQITGTSPLTESVDVQEFILPQAAVNHLKNGFSPIFLVKITTECLSPNQVRVVMMGAWMVEDNPVRLRLFKRSP